MSNERARVWAGTIYPGDSAPSDWLSILEREHIPGAISPLHTPDEEEKKPHRHVLFSFEGNKSRNQVRRIMDKVNGALLPDPINSIGGYARYMCHIDNPEKEQMNVAEVICLAGFDYYQYLVPSGTEIKSIVEEIDTYVLDNKVMEIHELVGYALKNNKDWYGVLQIPAQLTRMQKIIHSLRYSRGRAVGEYREDTRKKQVITTV